MNLISQFKKQIINYLTKDLVKPENAAKCENLIKFDESGCDISFAISLNIWSNYLKKTDDLSNYKNSILIFSTNNGETDENQALEFLLEASKIWSLPIEKACVEKGLCLIYFNKSYTFQVVLDLVNTCDYARANNMEDVTVFIDTLRAENSSITQFRVETMQKSLKNLIKFSRYKLTDDPNAANQKYLLTTRSNLKDEENPSNAKVIMVGVVCDIDKKISHADVENYLKKRQDDLHLIALHKYGVRVQNDTEFVELTRKLGRAAAILDMVEVKHSHALKLTTNQKHSFILYNSARLENLLNTFNDKVRENYYPELSSEINLNLLTEKSEWELLKHLLILPDIIEKSLSEMTNGQIALHAVYKYLVAFVNTFSAYYSRKKILIENRPHLIATIHAKIYLLKAIQRALNLVLEIFDIEPVLFM